MNGRCDYKDIKVSSCCGLTWQQSDEIILGRAHEAAGESYIP